LHYPLAVIAKAADALRAEGGRVTLTLVRESSCFRVVDILPGDTTQRNYGIAVDIGTTTVAVMLVFLPTAKIMAIATDYNDQVECGLDVISRINYAGKPGQLEDLRDRVLGTVNRLVVQVCRMAGVDPMEVSNVAMAVNTVMTHLLLGLNPEYIRLEPYTPTLLKVPLMSAREVGLSINPDSWVSLAPCVGSYVGGDITAGLLCTNLATDSEEVCLFIDIGTNGEIVIGNKDFLMSCACSAGPAFEGGGVSCGMRAAVGAIEKIVVDRESGLARYGVIGDVSARGICGSGMISLLAELFLSGWLLPDGGLDTSRSSPALP
ncbi:MAG: DUF4445 domain-containing protein, partial [Planctomycetes bacterium]|nr:DUF4445 domain-containing protein [Planctomycetota bacterium]